MANVAVDLGRAEDDAQLGLRLARKLPEQTQVKLSVIRNDACVGMSKSLVNLSHWRDNPFRSKHERLQLIDFVVG